MSLTATSVGMAISAFGAASKIATGIKQNSMANKINPIWDDSNVNNQLGTALNMFNGRMAGAGTMENNIRAAQGQTINNINKNATDASQALSLTQQTQNTADAAYDDLGTKEAQNKYSLLQNLNNAYGDANNNMKQKFQIETTAKSATREGAYKNMVGGINDAGALAIAYGGMEDGGEGGSFFGGNSGFGKLPGGGTRPYFNKNYPNAANPNGRHQ